MLINFDKGEIAMRIMVFNTECCRNYYKRIIDFDIMAKAINDCKPDIVG